MEVCRGELGDATSPFLYHSFVGSAVRPAHGCRDQRYQSQGELKKGHVGKCLFFYFTNVIFYFKAYFYTLFVDSFIILISH